MGERERGGLSSLRLWIFVLASVVLLGSISNWWGECLYFEHFPGMSPAYASHKPLEVLSTLTLYSRK